MVFSMKRRVIFLLLIIVAVSGTGCHSFRKKFIRKRKIQKEAPVYIDFKDYPDTMTQEAYIDYYLFVRGWLDELMGALEQNDSFKRKKRAITEAVMNIEQIIGSFNREGKEKVYSIYEEVVAIKQTIEKQPNLSNIMRNNLLRRTENVKRRFEKEFKYTDAEQWLD